MLNPYTVVTHTQGYLLIKLKISENKKVNKNDRLSAVYFLFCAFASPAPWAKAKSGGILANF
ncbi:hypothetical protein A4G19_07530 [Pasteurellaceae bacterium Macca]|nr:hypothetical protein [Pasteurellaceae bacterium Macca]